MDLTANKIERIKRLMEKDPVLLSRIYKYAPIYYKNVKYFFKKYKGLIFADLSLWFLAQGIVESRLNPKAKSSKGACGIMQLLPTTFNFVNNKFNLKLNNIWNPEQNIMAGIAYDFWLFDRLKRYVNGLPEKFILKLVFAEYNWRLGLYSKFKYYINKGIFPYNKLPKETYNYLNKIELYYFGLMILNGQNRKNT